MAQSQIPSPNPNSKFFVWIEGYGVDRYDITPEEFREEWIKGDTEPPTSMMALLDLIHPDRSILGIEEIKRTGNTVEVKYRYVDIYDDEEEEKVRYIYITYDLDEENEQSGYWNEVIESLENEGIPRNNVVKAWRLERIIYEIEHGRRVYYDDPNTVVIVKVKTTES